MHSSLFFREPFPASKRYSCAARLMSIALLSTGLSLVGCGGSAVPGGSGGGTGGGSGGGAGGATGNTNGQFTLVANSGSQESVVGTNGPNTYGDKFIELTMTLTNTGESTPLHDSYDLYSLSAASGLIYQPTYLSDQVSDPCPTSVTLGVGATVACDVVFEVPANTVAASVSYSDGLRTAAVSLSSVTLSCTCNGSYAGAPVNVACGQSVCLSGEQYTCLEAQIADDSTTCTESTDGGATSSGPNCVQIITCLFQCTDDSCDSGCAAGSSLTSLSAASDYSQCIYGQCGDNCENSTSTSCEDCIGTALTASENGGTCSAEEQTCVHN